MGWIVTFRVPLRPSGCTNRRNLRPPMPDEYIWSYFAAAQGTAEPAFTAFSETRPRRRAGPPMSSRPRGVVPQSREPLKTRCSHIRFRYCRHGFHKRLGEERSDVAILCLRLPWNASLLAVGGTRGARNDVQNPKYLVFSGSRVFALRPG